MQDLISKIYILNDFRKNHNYLNLLQYKNFIEENTLYVYDKNNLKDVSVYSSSFHNDESKTILDYKLITVKLKGQKPNFDNKDKLIAYIDSANYLYGFFDFEVDVNGYITFNKNITINLTNLKK